MRPVQTPELCGGEPCSDPATVDAFDHGTRFRDRVSVPEHVGEATLNGPVFFVRTIEMAQGTTYAKTQLTPNGAAHPGQVQVEHIKLRLVGGGQNMEHFIRLAETTPEMRVEAHLNTTGKGHLRGWWVVDTPSGTRRIMRVSERSHVSGRSVIFGPTVGELPKILRGPHVLRLLIDAEEAKLGEPLIYYPSQ